MSLGTKQKIAFLNNQQKNNIKAIKALNGQVEKLTDAVNSYRSAIGKLMAAVIILQEKGILTDEEIQEKFVALTNGNSESPEGSSVQSEGERPDEDSGGSAGSDVLSESGDSPDKGSDGDS